MLEGLTLTRAILTAQTCGEACWEAREDICRCSCGGANHGILRGKDGVQPVRSRKLQGFMYHLLAVEAHLGPGHAPIESMRPIEDLVRPITDAAIKAGRWERTYCATPGEPVKIKTASKDEVARWAELASWRGGTWRRPLVAWIRHDCRDLAG